MGALLLVIAMAAQTHGLVIVGQSLCVGGSSPVALSTTQIGSSTLAPIQLETGFAIPPSSWPWIALKEYEVGSGTDYGESPRSAMGGTFRQGTGFDVHVMSGCAGGTAYTGLKKGTTPFRYLQQQLEAFGSRNSNATCDGIVKVHGEQDQTDGTSRATYSADIREWRSDIEAKCNASVRAGQTVRMAIAQMSTWHMVSAATTPTTSASDYDVAKADWPLVTISSSDYSFEPSYSVHLTNAGARRLGAYAGRAIRNPNWRPVWPEYVSRSGTTLVVTYNVPSPPLVFDCNGTTRTDPGNYGFSHSAATVSNVQLCTAVDSPVAGCFAQTTCTGSGTPRAGCVYAGQTVSGISMTLSSASAGLLRMAWSGVTSAGHASLGPRSCLRDSDTETWAGYTLQNWAVHSEDVAP